MPHGATTEADEAAERDRPGLRTAILRGVAILGVLLVWMAVAGVGGPLVGRLSEVQENDNANFLPANAESRQVFDVSEDFTGEQPLPYFLVFERDGGLTEDDGATVEALLEQLPELELNVDQELIANGDDAGRTYSLSDYLVPEPPVVVPSEDGEATLVIVSIDSVASTENLPDGQTVVFAVAESLRGAVDQALEAGDLDGYVGGLGGILADFVIAFEGIDGTLLQVTLIVVFLILLLVYRSPILPFAALFAAVFGLAGAALVIYPLADNGVIDLNGQSQGILFILVVGAATDYALLLVSRFREELHDHPSKYVAMWRAWRAAVPPIVASASTVILGLLCLLLSGLGSNRGLGPVGATGVAFAMISALTLLPVLLLVPVVILALVLIGAAAGVGAVVGGSVGAGVAAGVAVVLFAAVAILRWRSLQPSGPGASTAQARGEAPLYARPESGRWLFWPRVPNVDHARAEDVLSGHGLWGRVAGLVGRRPRRVWVITLVALLALAAFVPTFKDDGISQTDIFRDRVDSVVAQEALERHFPAGSGAPAQVLVPEDVADEAVEVVEAVDGVVGATPYSGEVRFPPDPTDPEPEPVVVDDNVLLEVTLEPASDSPTAEQVVQTLRADLDELSADALVGGPTASNLDVRAASDRDLRVILPAILGVILVVLILLLRAIVAPLVIIFGTVVSFAATIGASALVFNHVLDLPGGDPAIPLYGFVFLVALGVDYSIFLMTRVREESVQRGTRPGVLVGLAVTGGVITSAGIVLAATFSALVTLPILFLLQISFIVAFGVLLDTLVVRSLLVPAMSYDLGRLVWWPSRLGRTDDYTPKHAGEVAVEDPDELAGVASAQPSRRGRHRAT